MVASLSLCCLYALVDDSNSLGQRSSSCVSSFIAERSRPICSVDLKLQKMPPNAEEALQDSKSMVVYGTSSIARKLEQKLVDVASNVGCRYHQALGKHCRIEVVPFPTA